MKRDLEIEVETRGVAGTFLALLGFSPSASLCACQERMKGKALAPLTSFPLQFLSNARASQWNFRRFDSDIASPSGG